MKKKINQIFLNNFFSLSLNQIINILYTIIITPILFKRIEVGNFGLVTLYFSIIMILAVIVGYGYNINAPKRIASFKKINDLQNLVNEVITTRLYFAFIILILSFTSLFFITDFSSLCIFYFSLIIVLSEAINPFFYFQGTDQLLGAALSNFFVKLLYLILIISFVNSKNDAYLVNLFFGLSSLIIYLITWVYIYIKNNLKWHFSTPKIVLKRLKENVYFTLSSLSGYLSINSALIVLSVFVNDSELGKFSIAHKIGLFLRMLPVFITQSILQEASRKLKNDRFNYNNFISNTYLYSLIFTLFLGIVISVFSKWIIYLFSGEYIIYSQIILSILSFVPFFSMLNFKNMISIILNERKKILNITSWYTVLLTFILGIIMSYYFGGLGMAISLIFSEIFNYILCNYFLKNDKK